jgi:glycosyltransferase involved in cell wall biosynthesis
VRPAQIDLPLVSIVTPSFNSARFIEQTILSVEGQDYRRIEHIVVDGGSVDGTIEILERYPGLVVVSEEDRGQSDALAKGFRMARGEIFAWLNADDFYYPGAVQAAVDALLRTDAALVYGGCDVVDEDGRVVETRVVGEYDFRRERDWGTKIMQPSTFFRRDAYEAAGGIDLRYEYAMDYDLWLKIGSRFPVACEPRTLAAFRLHPGSKSGSRADAFWPEVRKISRRHGAPYLSWLFLRRMEHLHPRLSRWLHRVRYAQDLVRERRFRLLAGTLARAARRH